MLYTQPIMTFRPGRFVEVQPSIGTWRRARVVSKDRHTYTVQYANDDTEDVLREVVRPPPPFRENAIYEFKLLGDLIEVLIDDVWKTARITDVGFRTGNPNKYFVVLNGDCREIRVNKSEIRRGRVFEQGRWIAVEKEGEHENSDSSDYLSTAATKPSDYASDGNPNSDSDSDRAERDPLEYERHIQMRFIDMQSVEVLKDNKWFKGTIVHIEGETLCVRYGNTLHVGLVPRSEVRPSPPFMDNNIHWSVGDVAEVRVDETWMLAKVKDISADSTFHVVVSTDECDELVVCVRQHLRRRRFWRDGRWITTRTRKDLEDRKRRRRAAREFDDSEASVDSCHTLYVSPCFDSSEDETEGTNKKRRMS